MTRDDIENETERLYRSTNTVFESISYEFNESVDFGNKNSKVTPFDLTIYRPETQKENRKYSIEELMAHGAMLIDASLYQYIRDKGNFSFSLNSQKVHPSLPSEIGEALFCVFHCLLTKSEIPQNEERIPKLIRDMFKNPESFNVYSKMIASFDINLMDKNWIKRISLYGVSREMKHRLTLGVMGHKVLDIFRIFKPSHIDHSEHRDIYYEVLKFASKGPSWDIFPLTSSPEKLRKFEHLESALKRIIYDLYTYDEKEKMARCGLLPHLPPRNYRKIEAYEFKEFKNFIFDGDAVVNQPSSKILSSKLTFPIYFLDSLEENSNSDDPSSRKKAFISFKP